MKKWNIGWGCISACNMHCAFCYSKSRRKSHEDLALPDWKDFVDKNHMYIDTINYGTGENSLSDDWFQLIRYIRDTYPNIRQALTTNGHIYKATADDTEKKNIFCKAIDEVDISLDFADKMRHNEFRGQCQAYDWAMGTLRLCQENEIPATIVMLGSEYTLYDENVEGIFRIAKSFDAVVRVNIYRPTNGINYESEQFILKPKTLLHFLEFVNEKYSVLAINDSLLAAVLVGKKEEDPSGINSLRILPNGDVTPSTYLITNDFVIGNIKEGIKLWELTDNAVLKNKMMNILPMECEKCEYAKMCAGGVVDRRYLWNGTLDKKDPYCIFDDEQTLQDGIVKIHLSDEKFSSVHDGYLPTMFFKNRKIIE